MMAGARSGIVFAAIVCGACGGGAPQVVTPPPLHITATPPAPVAQRARWVFSHPERGLVAKLDLGDAGMLYLGQNGRRELAKGKDALVDAPTLALGDLVGALKTPKGEIAFVGSDGTVYLAKEPLGTFDTTRPGPIGPDKPGTKLASPTTGKSAIVGIHPDGRVMRSADYGTTWTAVDYAGGAKPYGHAASVALDSKGNGVLVHFPQRLFVTHDDGATWAPLASSHIGVRSVQHDGDDRVIVTGYAFSHFKLEGNALAASDNAKPIYVPPPPPPDVAAASASPNDRTDVHTILTGDRVVELAEISRHGKVREIEIGSAPLGEKIDKPVVNADLVGGGGISKHIAGYGRDLVYLRDDDDADENAPTTTVFRSNNYGATWQKESQLQGVEAAEGEGIDVAAGPKGWVYVTSLCPKDEPSSTSCNHRQIRPASAAAFEDIAFVEEFQPLEFAFDEAHDKVYAIGLREGRKYVYESPLSQNKFSRTKLLDVSSYTKTALTVDTKGIARAFEFDTSKNNWVLHRRDETGKDMPPLYFAAERGTIALDGARGVIFAAKDHGWETNDGGDTWMRVATNGFAHDLLCSQAGCVNGDAQRVGWDLPAIQTQEKLTAQTDPVKPTTPPSPPHPPSLTPQEITCKVSGAPSPISSTPNTDMVDGIAADRWASIKHDTDSKIAIVVGTKSAVRELPLLAALPKPPAKAPANPEELRSGERVLNDGVVAARYRFAPRTGGGSYNPVDVELAWWSAVTGRTQHHTLPKVAPFRVSRYGFSGTPQIVDGGLLFQGETGDAAYFIHDDGKVEQLTLPKGAGIRQAERLPKRWILADTEGGAVQLTTSEDAGKSWKQTAWGLDQWGSISLTSIGDKASVSFASATLPTLLFNVDAQLPDDPPAPIVMDNVSVDTPCDAHAGRHRLTQYIPSDRRALRVHVENTKGADKWTTTFSPSTRVMHDAPNGKVCTSAYVMNGNDSRNYESQTAFVYPDGNGAWSGWRFKRPEDRNKSGMIAEPLTCK